MPPTLQDGTTIRRLDNSELHFLLPFLISKEYRFFLNFSYSPLPSLVQYDPFYPQQLHLHLHPSNTLSPFHGPFGLNNVAAYSLAYPRRLSAPKATWVAVALAKGYSDPAIYRPSLRSRSLFTENLYG